MIDHLDHLVLTTSDVDACVAFYVDVLGMEARSFTGGHPPVRRTALHFGSQKINIHEAGRELQPHAQVPQPGSLDLCFIADRPLDEVIAHLEERRVPMVEGPVLRTGATGPIRSVYVRDPDRNLVEISEIA